MLGSTGIVITHDSSLLQTRCFLVGSCDHQDQGFKNELKAHFGVIHEPFLYLVIWIELWTEIRSRRGKRYKAVLEDIQVQIGMHFTVTKSRLSHSSVDVAALIHRLTILWHQLAWDEFALKTLIHTCDKFCDIYESGISQSQHIRHFNGAMKRLHLRMANVRDLLLSLQRRSASSIQHASIQLQTVSTSS